MNEENEIPNDDDMVGMFLTFDDVKRICQSHIDNNDNQPYDDEEFEKIIKWINDTLISTCLVELVLKGDLDILFVDELPLNGEMMFKLTKQGEAKVENDPIFKRKMNDTLPGFKFE